MELTKSSVTLRDVRLGIVQAWRAKTGDLIVSAVLLIALAIAGWATPLGWVLIGAVVVNGARIFISAALSAREGRDLDTYLNAVFAQGTNLYEFSEYLATAEQLPETD